MHRYYRLARQAAEYVIPESWAWSDADESDLEYGCQVWPMAWQVVPRRMDMEYGMESYDAILVLDTPDGWTGDSPDGVAIDHEEIAAVRVVDRAAYAAYAAQLVEEYEIGPRDLDEIEDELAEWLEEHAAPCAWRTGDTLGGAR